MVAIKVIFCLAVMVCLANGAVIKLDPKISKDTSTYERVLLEKLIEKFQFERMLKNNDIEPQNEILVTEVAENSELRNLEHLRCSWNQNIGNCCAGLFRLPKLCIRMEISNRELQFSLTIGGHVILRKTFRGTFTKTFEFHLGVASISFTLNVETLSTQEFKACFRITYKVLFFHLSTNLGCIHKYFHSNEISPPDSIEDWNINDKVSFGAQVFQADTAKRLEYIGERNENADSLTWSKDAEK
ncbi:uncharacterized protein LOC106876301 [Octopus bimaculoides]|uniref:DUF4773 domain-containing protein n=1 Tax=Octopus bimaculoides TaxID=37653 RepID=A0A0L8GKD9_OCTBM|nr:uncharacterized protein LOC106876301 [Octopus bimaculoides]|eukprot:XP_014780285.1 PREDICTED: uncharacterized protein LOC106876301 [Octopus bimaculoides]